MPIEHELKFVLDPKNETQYRKKLLTNPGVTHYQMRQGYLEGNCRIRERVALDAMGIAQCGEYFFTYKSKVSGEQVEIETDIDQRDFDRLWSKVVKVVTKERIVVPHGDDYWEIDFFSAANHTGSYLIMAEVELEPGVMTVELPPFIKDQVLHAVQYGDKRFNSKQLSKPYTAMQLLEELRNGKFQPAQNYS
jgi:CYTH domain-containing protein